MSSRWKLLAVCVFSTVVLISAQGYGQDPEGGENCRVTGCGKNAYCTTDYNSHTTTCRCNIGFEVSPTNKSNCVDIYECAHREVCQNGECINTIGGFRCRCYPGYTPAADQTFCLYSDWAPQQDPWNDFWGGLMGFGTQSEPAFDYSNPWGNTGPLSNNYVDKRYKDPYYNEYGNNYIDPSQKSMRTNSRFPQDNLFQQPRNQGNPNFYPENNVNKQAGGRQDLWRVPNAAKPKSSGMDFWNTPAANSGNKQVMNPDPYWNQGSNQNPSDPWNMPVNTGSNQVSNPDPWNLPSTSVKSSGIPSWNDPANQLGNVNPGKPATYPKDPTTSGQTIGSSNTATANQWTGADSWNTQTNPQDRLNPPQTGDLTQNTLNTASAADPTQILHTEPAVDRQVGAATDPLNTNSITSGAAAILPSANQFKDPNSVSSLTDPQWLNFGQTNKIDSGSAVPTWEPTSNVVPDTASQTSSYTPQNEVGTANTNTMPSPDNLTGHPLLLYLIMQNIWQ